ncbi:hypothetical protein FHS29_007165 [Saccharothrix tamanrassetensis]|uniref:Secreted protein n=1 Tax=Saccharothrix tamanrassetensis TaxID=1051531 RepID=A0A841CX20_9PSEU|nr:hypothetical protein [Saccharothrix tamanrassetensis]MBB5960537.1 hypothetical protein [Saccharothrix tamanrassetensis]
MSRVKRLLSRALLVAGGTLAGTAAAWALSTAPATAQVADHEDAVTVVTHVVTDREPVRQVVAPVRETVLDLDAALRAQRAGDAAPPDLGQVAEGIRDTFGHVHTWFEPRSTGPVRTDHALTGRAVAVAVAVRQTEPAQNATAVPVSVGTPVVRGPFGKLSETWSSSSAQQLDALPGEPHHSRQSDPAGPPFAPFAPPLGVPVHCSCGGDGAGSAGGGNGPFTGTTADGVDPAVARALLPATERNTVMPGKQPGITPD